MKKHFTITIGTIILAVSQLIIYFPSFSNQKDVALSNNFNIVLITIDALRADHLSCYGYERKTSPNIDRIAEKGIIFENTIAPCSWTTPSMVSLFTSTYPINHGVAHGFGKKGKSKQEIFSDELTTLAEILKAHGYTTFGVASNINLDDKLGFARGFDYFQCLPFLPAPAVNKTILSWEDDIKKSGSFFLWVHYFDPHHRYHARNPWYEQYISHASIPNAFGVNENFTSMKPMELTALMYELRQRSDEQSKRQAIQLKETLLARYDSEINYVDSYIGELIKKFNLNKNTLIIITADHGEEFFEHDLVGHGTNLYQKALHIPLIIKLPYSSKKKTVKKYANLVDIMPTILYLLDIGPPEQTLGKPVMKKRGPLFWVKKIFSRKEMAEYNFAELKIFSDLKTIITAEWKYIYSYKKKTEQLYNIKSDPLELNNLIDKKNRQREKLKSRLFKWVSGAKQFPPTRHQVELTPEEEEKLKGLGYI